MAFKIEIISDNALRVTNTTTGDIEISQPKLYTWYEEDSLVAGYVKFYGTTDKVNLQTNKYTYNKQGNEFKGYPIEECVDELDVTFTIEIFRTFASENLGKHNGGSTPITTSQGWENVADSIASNITAGTTPVKLTFNGLGSATETRYRPKGVAMFNTTTNRFVPINLGDAGELRIYMTSTNLTSNPTRIDIIFDIGSDNTTPTIPIYTHPYTLKNVNVQPISMHFAWFQLETFLANGGQIFAQVNSGTVTIGQRSIFLKKDMDGIEILNSQPE